MEKSVSYVQWGNGLMKIEEDTDHNSLKARAGRSCVVFRGETLSWPERPSFNEIKKQGITIERMPQSPGNDYFLLKLAEVFGREAI